MTRYTVLPRDDGTSTRQSWMVHENSSMKSSHVKKSAAVNKAREYASNGDTLQIRKTDGTIQKTVTVRNASDSESTEDNPLIPGEALFETGVSDFFR